VRLSHGLLRGAAAAQPQKSIPLLRQLQRELLKMGMLKQPWFAMGVEILFSNKGRIPDLERCVTLKTD